MTEKQIKCRKAYYSIAKEKCPFTDEDLQNGYCEGFMDGAFEMARKGFEATKELQEEINACKFAMTMSEKVEKQLREQIKKMKNCANCKHSIEEYGEFTCPFTKDNNFCSIAYNTENNSLWELKE